MDTPPFLIGIDEPIDAPSRAIAAAIARAAPEPLPESRYEGTATTMPRHRVPPSAVARYAVLYLMYQLERELGLASQHQYRQKFVDWELDIIEVAIEYRRNHGECPL